MQQLSNSHDNIVRVHTIIRKKCVHLGCRISFGTLECTVTIVTQKAHVVCRQVGRELHELKPALPLFDGVTGQPKTVWNDVVCLTFTSETCTATPAML